MANIVFDSEMFGALTHFENDLYDSTISTINNSKNATTYKTADLARENTRRYRDYLATNISDLKIENIMTNYFEELKKIEKNHVIKIKDSLKQLTDSVIRMSEKKDIDELESAFTVLTNELTRSANSSIYEEINQKFAKQIESYVSKCFLYTPRIDEALSDVKRETRRLLDKHCEKLMEEFQINLKSYLTRYRNKILETMRNQLKENISEQKGEENSFGQDIIRERTSQNKNFVSANEMQFLIPTLKHFGLIVEDTFDGFTVKTANSNEEKILYKGDDGHFFTEDHSIEIEDMGSNYTSVTIGDKIITETLDACYLGTRNNPQKIVLKMDFLEYKVNYAGVEQNDLLKKGKVLEEIAKNYPDYYDHLSRETIFASMKQEIEEAKKEAEELQKDEYGKIHINPNTRAAFVDKVGALGYTLDEREDGIYAIDRQGGTHKLQYNSGYAYFEDNPRIGFNTNAYFVTENEIKGPIIDYHYNNDTLNCSTDYLFLTISGSGKVCRLGYNSDDKFIYEIDMGNKVVRNIETTKRLLKNACPELYEKIAIACMKHQEELQSNIKSSKEAREDGVSQEIVQSNTEKFQKEASTDDLLNELDAEEQFEKIDIEAAQQEIKNDVNIVEEEIDYDKSIADEIFALEQDPNVQRYIELMKLQAERQSLNQESKMGI